MSVFYERLKRNKRKIIYLTGIIGGSYAVFKVTKYLRYYYNKYQTDNSLHFKIQKAQYFQSMLINSLDTIETILKNVENEIELTIDAENVASSLGFVYKSSSQSVEHNKQQYSALSADEKLELWKKFTVLSFTKLTLLVYSWSFICITIHIQMSILAGNLFQTKKVTHSYFSVFSTYYEMIFPSNKEKFKSIDDKFQMEFINLTWKQLKSQISDWTNLIQKMSYKIVASMSLKQRVTSDNVLEILGQIIDGVHNDILELFLHNIQLQTSNKLIEAEMYALLANVFESSGIGYINDFISLLSKHISSSLNTKINSSKRSDNEIETLGKIPLAKLVPFIWTSFINENKVSIFNSIRGFFSTPQFRFMLFNSYENSMEKINI